MSALFQLGTIVATPGALDLLLPLEATSEQLLKRHVTGDYGDVCAEDKEANDGALKCGARIMSVYKVDGDTKVWIITEADRSVTTLLLPSEY